MLLRAVFVALVCVLSPGCYYQAPLATKTNQPQQLEVQASQSELMKTVEDLVDEQGWWIASKNPRTGTIIAVTETESLGGMVTRQRWVFHARDGGVSVQSFLDHVKAGQWTSTDEVCETYGYAAERAQLRTIDARATMQRLGQARAGSAGSETDDAAAQ